MCLSFSTCTTTIDDIFVNVFKSLHFQTLVSLVKILTIKGQLQRFHKLISNDITWPSEYSFEVIFEKSVFVFEISALKVRN